MLGGLGTADSQGRNRGSGPEPALQPTCGLRLRNPLRTCAHAVRSAAPTIHLCMQFSKINTVEDMPPNNMVDVVGAGGLVKGSGGLPQHCMMGRPWRTPFATAAANLHGHHLALRTPPSLLATLLFAHLAPLLGPSTAAVVDTCNDWTPLTKRDGGETQVRTPTASCAQLV